MVDIDEFGFPVSDGWPEIDARGMAEIDDLMIGFLKISLEQMMENAGRAVAKVARDRYFGGDCAGRRVAVLAGPGGNGGGALTAARRLAGWGATIDIVLSGSAETLAEVPRHQLSILKAMGHEPANHDVLEPELIIDGLIGYSLSGIPRGRAADLIAWANVQPAPTLSLDVPSGYEAQSGRLSPLSILADATMTLALPKMGMSDPVNRAAIGALYLADISVPPFLYARIGAPIILPAFSFGDILRIG